MAMSFQFTDRLQRLQASNSSATSRSVTGSRKIVNAPALDGSDKPDKFTYKLVGPTSSSNTVWLSATETAGDIGNVPSIGWSGKAYKNGFGTGSPGAGNTGWWNDTAVFSTRMYLFSSFIYGGANVRRIGVYNLSGYNPNFYWSDYDFSGIGYLNVSDPSWNGRITSISPVHFVAATHFPAGGVPAGTLIKFINKNGSVTTRTVLSSVATGADYTVGVYDAPVSGAAYPIGSLGNFVSGLSAVTDIKNFLWGPSTTGKVGIMAPRSISNYTGAPTTYLQLTSIPKSLWYTEYQYVADSSTQFWYADPARKQLVVLGLTYYAGPQMNSYNLQGWYTTIYNTATALCKQFYGDPLMYQLTAYNF